jgi:hypothetical protein
VTSVEKLADVTCVECRRRPQLGEVWRLYFADIGELAIYCPECSEREFGAASSPTDPGE